MSTDAVLRRRRVSNALLAAGYGLSASAGLKFVPMWRQRRVRRFLAFEMGTALVVSGLVLRRRTLEAAANSATGAALAVAWLVTGRRRS